MLKPPVPENEEARLSALRELEVLDTEIEERYERITRSVCRVLDVPISAISLVDTDRQWFKSVQGLSVRETSRDISFCGHAILGNDEFVIPDAMLDERFRSNPLVTGSPNIRAYAAYPLTSAGHNIGTLCAIDTKPRKFSAEQLEFLRDLAGIVEADISMRISTALKANAALEATLETVLRALDARDSYAAGHQDRTVRLAVAIAEELGWSKDKIRGLWLSAVVHDVGKICTPTALLTKPTRLTVGERMVIEQHAAAGYEILKKIISPWPIADIVHQHHERLDGSGYPRGLKGDEILPEARVLSIADIVDSMSSSRPYRLETALAEIEKLAASNKLDAEFVSVCLKLFREKGFKIIRQ